MSPNQRTGRTAGRLIARKYPISAKAPIAHPAPVDYSCAGKHWSQGWDSRVGSFVSRDVSRLNKRFASTPKTHTFLSSCDQLSPPEGDRLRFILRLGPFASLSPTPALSDMLMGAKQRTPGWWTHPPGCQGSCPKSRGLFRRTFPPLITAAAAYPAEKFALETYPVSLYSKKRSGLSFKTVKPHECLF